MQERDRPVGQSVHPLRQSGARQGAARIHRHERSGDRRAPRLQHGQLFHPELPRGRGLHPRAIPKAAQERIKSHPCGSVAGSPNMTKARRPDSGAARRLLLLRVRGPRRGPERQELRPRAPSPPGWHKTTDRKEPAAPFFGTAGSCFVLFFYEALSVRLPEEGSYRCINLLAHVRRAAGLIGGCRSIVGEGRGRLVSFYDFGFVYPVFRRDAVNRDKRILP